jgi:SPP1 family predicted phage head-tail adaptor
VVDGSLTVAKFERYRHQVTFQSPVYGETDEGDATNIVDWEDVEPVDWWASIKPLSGREASFAMARMESVSHQVECRFREDVAADWRIKINPTGNKVRYLQIGAAWSPDERGDVLVCLCTENKDSA